MIEIDNEKFYSAKEAAEKLNISIGRLAQLRKEGKIKYNQVSERKFLYSETNIRNYVLFKHF